MNRLSSHAAPRVYGGVLLGALVALATPAAPPAPPAPAAPAAQRKIDYNRDVRHILSNNCFACHGFDEKARKGKLRLDQREAAIERNAILPGKPEQSELVKRITPADPDDHMPPPDSGKALTAREVAVLRQWIAEGAPYAGHWSFEPAHKPELPPVAGMTWARNEIDRFILARLEREGLNPAPEAPREMLIRRVTFDLTGLPPTPAEVEAFVKDRSPDAYEKVVDRLLKSPHYGERMAVEWLDAARYADTHGYHIDSGRDMTAWREWVIDAFNANKSFDKFTVEQLAGDLIPNATTDQKIASGFNRNHMINFEGGAIPEEYHSAYLVDRVNTTATVWMGLTLNCAQCHDHKFDPLTMKDFYGMYAFFNNVPENGLDGSRGNAKPFIRTPTKEQAERVAALDAAIAKAESGLEAESPEFDAAQAAWERTALKTARTTWTALDPTRVQSKGGATLTKQPDKSVRASGTNPGKEVLTVHLALPPGEPTTALRLEVLPDDSLRGKGPGRSDNGNLVLTEVKVLGADGKPLGLRAASADFAQDGFAPSGVLDKDNNTGWAIFPAVGQAHHLVVELAEALPPGQAVRAVFEFNSRFAGHHPGRFRVSATASPNPHGSAALPDAVAKALAVAPEQRTAAQRAEIRRHYRLNQVPAFAKARADVAALKKQRAEIEAGARTTMVMEEMPKPRDTFMLVRGQYDKKGEKVTAHTPAALPPLKVRPKTQTASASLRPQDAGLSTQDFAPDRLDLANWLVAPENPLTARVIVNRYWQMYFGTGIVKTVEDFGSQGEWPSHPELLDYLAWRFVDSGWDVKAMQRLIVTSAAYRQTSAASPDLYARDPENRLIARASRFRLAAEFVRDQALAVSGLLDGRIGGYSVSPYQPAGLWEELMSREDGAKWSAQTYVQSHGADLYRRTMYTFWKRTSPPPTLSTFDAPDREVCTVRRPRTNTPLQALVLMNDPTYVEASRKFAERVLTDPGAGASTDDRIAWVFRHATARAPKEAEVAVLKAAYERHLARFRADPAKADKLLAVGESPVKEGLDKPTLAAWAMVSSVILNLDEVVTRN